MPTPTHLLWLDLETSGTDEAEDAILEVATILTDMDLQVLDATNMVVLPDAPFTMLKVVEDMHTANGLLADIKAERGWPLATAESAVVNMMEEANVEKHCVMLAGSGVGHFDMRFVRALMPGLAKWLAYPVIDVGTIRRFLRDVVQAPGLLPPDADSDTKTHRAFDDIRQHLNEALHYQILFGSLAGDA